MERTVLPWATALTFLFGSALPATTHAQDDGTALKLSEERVAPGEKELFEKLVAVQLEAMDAMPGNRGYHPKQHGRVDAKFTVGANVPEKFRQCWLTS